jgi:hypothetical protein
MINPQLHKQPTALDRTAHRNLKLDLPDGPDLSFSAELNGVFVPVGEFTDVCREYPIVFVRTNANSTDEAEYAPLAVLGMEQNQNLYLLDGKRWRADYLPVLLRTYPFCIGRMNDEKFAICLDMSWKGVNEEKGLSLFAADGEPTEQMANTIKQLELLEGEIQRTRLVCATLAKLGVMKSMRFDATTASGRKLAVDGFFSIDAEVMQNLPDSTVGDLHRSGVLGMVQLHWASMNGMRRLVDWHGERTEGAATAPTAPAVTPSANADTLA